MVIHGPSLCVYYGSSVPLLRVGCVERNWQDNGSSSSFPKKHTRRSMSNSVKSGLNRVVTGFISAAAVMACMAAAYAIQETRQPETLSNIPQTLSGECASAKDCKKATIQRPKSRKAESCTIKCVTTCIRGGEGSPGEGPLNVRRPLVVFKQGFRTRQY